MKININIPKPSKIFNKHIYETLNDYSHLTEVHYGGASSGKSHGVVQKVVLKSLKDWEHPRKVLWLRKVGVYLRDSIYADVISCLSDFKILDYCKINKSNFEIELPNGAIFLFKGMDDPEKIKSIKGISDVVMEEASEFTLNDYTQLKLRLRDPKHKDRQLFLMFNPVSKANWVYKNFFLRDNDDTIIHHSTYKDNRFLDEEAKRALDELAESNPVYYKIYAVGMFATLDKLVFPRYTKTVIDVNEVRHLPSYFGLDFGYVNDPSAFVHVKVDYANKKLYIMEEYVKKHMLNDEIARTIKSLGYQKERILADSAEQKSIAEIRRLGVSNMIAVKKWPDSVRQGISYISQFEIIVNHNCVKTMEELENYTWKKDRKTQEYINEPVDAYNHCIDAIRYALSEAIFKVKDSKPMDKFKQLRRLGL